MQRFLPYNSKKTIPKVLKRCQNEKSQQNETLPANFKLNLRNFSAVGVHNFNQTASGGLRGCGWRGPDHQDDSGELLENSSGRTHQPPLRVYDGSATALAPPLQHRRHPDAAQSQDHLQAPGDRLQVDDTVEGETAQKKEEAGRKEG